MNREVTAFGITLLQKYCFVFFFASCNPINFIRMSESKNGQRPLKLVDLMRRLQNKGKVNSSSEV